MNKKLKKVLSMVVLSTLAVTNLPAAAAAMQIQHSRRKHQARFLSSPVKMVLVHEARL